MTTPSTYSKEVFEQLYRMSMGVMTADQAKPIIEIRDDGVYADQVDCATLDWTPSCDLMEPGSADPLTTPLLPFPFTVNHLASFMLDGWGYFMQEACGDWATGPDEAMLQRIPVRGGKVKEALCGAYAAYRDAERVVEKLDEKIQIKTRKLEVQFQEEERQASVRENFRERGISEDEYRERHARYKASIAKLGKRMEKARRQSDEALAVWRKAMVNQLLLQKDDNQTQSDQIDSAIQKALDGRNSAAGELVRYDLAIPVAKSASVSKATETPEQRRARWLKWYGNGERGAVKRVYEREKLLNPRAERSFIGKEIKKAKNEKNELKRAGNGWTSQLVQDGKRRD